METLPVLKPETLCDPEWSENNEMLHFSEVLEAFMVAVASDCCWCRDLEGGADQSPLPATLPAVWEKLAANLRPHLVPLREFGPTLATLHGWLVEAIR